MNDTERLKLLFGPYAPAAKQPKSEEWKRKASEIQKARGTRPRNPALREWTPEEESVLGTATDREVAAKLGRSIHGVRERRRKLGIAPFQS